MRLIFLVLVRMNTAIITDPGPAWKFVNPFPVIVTVFYYPTRLTTVGRIKLYFNYSYIYIYIYIYMCVYIYIYIYIYI